MTDELFKLGIPSWIIDNSLLDIYVVGYATSKIIVHNGIRPSDSQHDRHDM